jgi:hypothetical protein
LNPIVHFQSKACRRDLCGPEESSIPGILNGKGNKVLKGDILGLASL